MASDALVIGGGAFGLNAALALAQAGRRVTLVDPAGGAGDPGAASMGLVGALGPHLPAPWTPLKALQFEALVSLPLHAAALEAATGLSPGWRATGRLQPLHDDAAWERAASRAPGAAPIWAEALDAAPAPLRDGARAAFGWAEGPRAEIVDAPPDPAWMAPPARGAWWDDLAALISPRRYCAALAAACRAEGVEFVAARARAVDEGGADTDAGRLSAALTVVAAGAGSAKLLAGKLPLALSAEKGQAAFFNIAPPPGAMLIHQGGIWIVPHADGIAVGSTAEKNWPAPGPDPLLDGVLEQAAALCPLLLGREADERWAGLRPRAPGRGPLLGPVPGRGDAQGGLWAATGGHKIGVALSHHVARLLVRALGGAPLPGGLAPADRI
ncbi:NAD(P)/FAD-dependent oxidoreductase [Rhodovulum sp. DZ06]|uniref:NAD(P)/FAD-dependent oxidoreductase n=1 Tax=Rhodovulum sp. DZ06 TaxID=3425126 RepID=UPI003D33D4FA